MSVSRAKHEIPAHEFLCWLEDARREKNEANVTNLYLHDIAFHLYQLRRAWSDGLPSVPYEKFVREIRYRRAADDRPKADAPVQSVQAQKSVLCGWLGVNVGQQVMSSS